MPTELVTAVQERVKVIVVLVQNHGFHSIGSLSEALGSQRFGTSYRFRGARRPARRRRSCPSTSPPTPAASAPTSSRCTTAAEPRGRRSRRPRRRPRDGGPVVIHVETDPLGPRARQRLVVGRAGGAGLGTGQHAGRLRRRTPRRRSTSTPTSPRPREGAATVTLAPLRVGVIGVGMMGTDHAERLSRRTAGVVLAGVTDPDTDRAAALRGAPRRDCVRRPARPRGRAGGRRGASSPHRGSCTRSRCSPACSTARRCSARSR